MEKYLKEVEKIILNISPTPKPEKWMAKNYVGAGKSKLKFLDIKIPLVRKAFKEGFSFFKINSINNNNELCWKIFDHIWKNSDIFEVMLLSSYFASSRPVEDKLKHSKLILSWQKKVDNWAHSDELSSHFSQMLEEKHELIKVFKTWNHSKNSWERRQSLVGLLFYARARKKHLAWKTIKPFIDNLLNDNDYYVQKGVGWCLRESYNVYPEKVFEYLNYNCGQLSPIAWVASTEKLNEQNKKKLFIQRKKLREMAKKK